MRVVQKFGGSSVADAESIKRVARRVADRKDAGDEVVVVISAMGDTTDDLLDLAYQVSSNPAPRELDMLLTTGERQSAALLALALDDIGYQARSYTGSQAGVITTATHGNARIVDITPGRIIEALDEGDIVIVAGFQGVAQATKDITTLGRGASDTTAVAFAYAIGADYCEIYTDVDGIFTADPRIVSGAQRIPEIQFEEMLELAACGAKILHLRSVEYARVAGVKLHVRSSFSDKPGTWVLGEADMNLNKREHALISGIAHDVSEGKITVVGVPDVIGSAASIFDLLAGNEINIDMIVQNVSALGTSRTDISFTLPRSEIEKAMKALEEAKDKIQFEDLRLIDQVGKVSVVGVGMRTHPGVTARFFGALADAGVNISMISTSEIRISVVVDVDKVEDAVRAAHTAFNLDSEGQAVVYAGTGR